MRLRPHLESLRRDKALLDLIDARRLHRTVHLRPMGGTAARDLVDHIHGIAAAHEVMRPAFAAVRRAGEVRAGLAAAVNHDDGIAVPQPLRNHVLDIHLSDRRAALNRGIDLAADEEITRLGENERPALLRMGGRHQPRARREENSRIQYPAALGALFTILHVVLPIAATRLILRHPARSRNRRLDARYSRSRESRDAPRPHADGRRRRDRTFAAAYRGL